MLLYSTTLQPLTLHPLTYLIDLIVFWTCGLKIDIHLTGFIILL